MKRGAGAKALLIVVLLVMINFPVLHSDWIERRIAQDGADVVAAVTDERVLSPDTDDAQYFLFFELPATVDPDRSTWDARVDAATYDEAVRTGELAVRVLPDDPAAYAVEGQQRGSFGLWMTLFADLILLAVVVLMIRYRRQLSPRLRLVALEDVHRCPPGGVLERLDDGTYLACGDITAIEGDELELDVGSQTVRILLDGHANPVGYDQPASVRGRVVG